MKLNEFKTRLYINIYAFQCGLLDEEAFSVFVYYNPGDVKNQFEELIGLREPSEKKEDIPEKIPLRTLLYMYIKTYGNKRGREPITVSRPHDFSTVYVVYAAPKQTKERVYQPDCDLSDKGNCVDNPMSNDILYMETMGIIIEY